MTIQVTKTCDASFKDYFENRIAGSVVSKHIDVATTRSQASVLYIVATSGINREEAPYRGRGGRRADATHWLRSRIQEYLLNSPSNVVLVEDVTSVPELIPLDAIIPCRFTVYEDRVFWIIVPPCLSDDLITKTFSWAVGGPEYIIFSAFNQNDVYKDKSVITDDEFSDIMTRASILATDIFDGEGYLLWTRPDNHDLQTTP